MEGEPERRTAAFDRIMNAYLGGCRVGMKGVAMTDLSNVGPIDRWEHSAHP